MQTYRTEAGANAHTQTVVSASRGPITRTVVTLEGKQSVTTTQKGSGIQTVTTTYVTDPTTGEITSSIVTSSIAFDEGVVPVTTVKRATVAAGFCHRQRRWCLMPRQEQGGGQPDGRLDLGWP